MGRNCFSYFGFGQTLFQSVILGNIFQERFSKFGNNSEKAKRFSSGQRTKNSPMKAH